jgi:hypothetical protein
MCDHFGMRSVRSDCAQEKPAEAGWNSSMAEMSQLLI